MEDYDVLNEMHSINQKIVMLVEDDEKLFFDISSFCEVMPLRFSYDLSNFSDSYIEKTKKLFSYYFNLENSYKNELLRLKKHFTHFSRFPFILYISKSNNNYEIINSICEDLNIECVTNKQLFIKKIKNNRNIFLIDSDGTLKDSQGLISKQNINAIKRIKESKDYAIICTARPRYNAIQVMKESEASNYIISFNGGEIYDLKNNKIIKAFFINKSIAYKIIKDCFELNLRLVISTDKFDFVTKEVRNASQKILNNNYVEQLRNYRIKTLMIIDKDKKKVNMYKHKLKNNKNIAIINEKGKTDKYYEEWFVVGNKKSNKGCALINISNHLGIPIHNVIAIGNDYNDIPMLKISGISFVVNNSDETIKKYADYIVSSNEETPILDMVNIIYK